MKNSQSEDSCIYNPSYGIYSIYIKYTIHKIVTLHRVHTAISEDHQSWGTDTVWRPTQFNADKRLITQVVFTGLLAVGTTLPYLPAKRTLLLVYMYTMHQKNSNYFSSASYHLHYNEKLVSEKFATIMLLDTASSHYYVNHHTLFIV